MKIIKFNIYYDYNPYDWSYTIAFNKALELLKIKYPKYKFTFIDSKSVRDSSYDGNGHKYGPFYMYIENNKTKKFFIISYWDKLKDIYLWDLNKCAGILTSSGTHENDIFYHKLNLDFTPISYIGTRANNEELIENLYESNYDRHINNKPNFKGLLYLFRDYLLNDNRFEISRSNLSIEEYLKELNKSQINFSINGAGEICHRDIEILGLGTTLFRTKLVTEFNNKLVPDYHYISVNIDDIPTDIDMYVYWKMLSDRIIERYNEVKDDIDFLKFVAKNGRDWYVSNGTTKCNSEIIVNNLNLSLLN